MAPASLHEGEENGIDWLAFFELLHSGTRTASLNISDLGSYLQYMNIRYLIS